jgi:energy-converting hydrogenase Eha subunit A
VQETTAPILTAWESFYVIIGSSGAALTGLMFVVITLISDSRRRRSERAIAAFSTPTIIHFGSALLISAILSAPWRTLAPVGLSIGLVGLAGIAYLGMVFARMRALPEYTAVLEDWLWNAVLPFIAYFTFFVTAFPLPRHPEPSLFGVAGATILLLFIGIHNAWDIVTFLVLDGHAPADAPPPAPPNVGA